MSEMGQDALATMVEGKSDDEINQAVEAQGVDTVLAAIFQGMKDRFQPDKAAGQTANIQWDINAPDKTYSFQFQVKEGACDVVPNATDAAKVTLTLALPDFLRFIAGKLDGMQAFMTGKLKLGGDMMFAQTMQAWFAQA